MTRQRPAYEVSPGLAVGLSRGVPCIAFLEADGGWTGAVRDPKRGLLMTRDAERIRNDQLALGHPDTLWVAIYLVLAVRRDSPNWGAVIRAVGVREALRIATKVRRDDMEPVHRFFGGLPRSALVSSLNDADDCVRTAAIMALGRVGTANPSVNQAVGTAERLGTPAQPAKLGLVGLRPP